MANAPQPMLAGVQERSTIQIMRSFFQSDDLSGLAQGLEREGHRCKIFDDLTSALRSPTTKLLLLSVTEDNWRAIIAALRSDSGNVRRAPVLAYLKLSRQNIEGLFVPEIDDFLVDPIDRQTVVLRIHRLLKLFDLKHNEVEQARLRLPSHFGTQQFIGQSPAFLAVIDKIPRIAASSAGVLLMGETGTGKELCARFIHYLSPRESKPFIPINCGSIPTDLFENELFGHEHGAFTSASQSVRGLVSEAEGGTLFLDEVDSLPLSAQAKLLRFLQDRQYKPLGGSAYRQADTRLIAGTNKDLLEKVRSGEFREDLYYRVRIILLHLPPLRDRREDIIPLALHFLRIAAREYKSPATRFSQSAIQKLLSHPWPGNVRELENIVREAVVFAEGQEVNARDLHLPTDATPSFTSEPLKLAKARAIEEFERNYLKEALASCGGNISKAARKAQKDRRTFFALLKKYGLTREPLSPDVTKHHPRS